MAAPINLEAQAFLAVLLRNAYKSGYDAGGAVAFGLMGMAQEIAFNEHVRRIEKAMGPMSEVDKMAEDMKDFDLSPEAIAALFSEDLD